MILDIGRRKSFIRMKNSQPYWLQQGEYGIAKHVLPVVPPHVPSVESSGGGPNTRSSTYSRMEVEQPPYEY
jgi:hypothetical protein